MSDKKIEIPGVNAEYGLGLCDDDQEIYLSSLRLYSKNIPGTLEKMKTVCENTIKDYTVCVHGIKGMSEYIGALDIKMAAKDLEEKAKNGNLDAILSENAAFIKKVENLLSCIGSWLEKNDA
ncbi:MAG: Hpt domain-containing protein [Treponema sp.]|nr:Hpt domain-containing protein [Treponema sp.]